MAARRLATEAEDGGEASPPPASARMTLSTHSLSLLSSMTVAAAMVWLGALPRPRAALHLSSLSGLRTLARRRPLLRLPRLR